MAILAYIDVTIVVIVLYDVVVTSIVDFDASLDPRRGLLSSINVPLGDPHVRSVIMKGNILTNMSLF